jgi:ATP-dependent Clp protease protease subunit
MRHTERFWNWVRDADTGARTLYLDGVIAQESWFEDDITPKAFRKELYAEDSDIDVYINSPGGDVFAASQIYTMLIEYPHSVTVKVDGVAASAASVVAMAGTEMLMAPTASLMIHNPATFAIGDTAEMQKAIAMLEEVKESLITAYEVRPDRA